MNTRLAMTAVLGLSMLVALGACGRKGALEPPPGAVETPGCPSAPAGQAAEPQPIETQPIETQPLNRSGYPNEMPETAQPPC